MSKINVLSDDTINKIAAGEVVERPLSVVKELVENSIDSGASSITVEIKDGGIKFIRVTDNGSGIEKDDIKNAFLRHATSKIKEAEDLLEVASLGFRGEALASIASIARCELITKTSESISGIHYVIEGGAELAFEDIGAPDGTTIIVRDIFYNTPARKKFLKSASTEGAYIVDAVSKIALAHPEVSIHLISNGQTKIHTSGNGNKKDVIYVIYGKEASKEVLEISANDDSFAIKGYIGKPNISRGNRSYEVFEVNGRTIKSKLLSSAVEDAYHTFVMQHRYPFCVLSLKIPSDLIDVNVHPTKLEIRFRKEDELYEFVKDSVLAVLRRSELIVNDTPVQKEESFTENTKPIQPFEKVRIEEERQVDIKDESSIETIDYESSLYCETSDIYKSKIGIKMSEDISYEQVTIPETRTLSKTSKPNFKILGIVFDTYILVEYKEDFLMIDQHAAHEKVMFERFMKEFKEHNHTSQQVNPPIVLTLSDRELDVLSGNLELFTEIGYEIEPFGGKEVAVYSVPGNMYSIVDESLLIEMLDDLADEFGHGKNTLLTDKIAMMSCKAAVKGNQRISMIEAETLIEDLLSLEDPYTCPHGRPTTIRMSKTDIEKKFKRIV